MRNEYNTRQNQLLLDCLAENKNMSLTVDELCRIIERRGGGVGRATVYRRLEKLAGEKLVRKFTDGGKSATYRYVGEISDCEHHYHMVCSVCGMMQHIDCAEMDELKKHLKKQHDFSLDSFKSVLYGVCGDCAKRKEKSK